MKYTILILLLTVLLASCSEFYRYPCQNPSNWEKEYCKKPYCSANGTCPEDLTHYDKDKVNKSAPSTSFAAKGECK